MRHENTRRFESVGISADPAEVKKRLDEHISETAKPLLDGEEYKLTVATVRESGSLCVPTGDAEITFPNSMA